MADWEFSLLFVLFKKQHFCCQLFSEMSFFLEICFHKIIMCIKDFYHRCKGYAFQGDYIPVTVILFPGSDKLLQHKKQL